MITMFYVTYIISINTLLVDTSSSCGVLVSLVISFHLLLNLYLVTYFQATQLKLYVKNSNTNFKKMFVVNLNYYSSPILFRKRINRHDIIFTILAHPRGPATVNQSN